MATLPDPIQVNHNAPNKLIVLTVLIEVDGVPQTYTGDYQVCIYPYGTEVLQDDPAWQAPDTTEDGASGIFVGPEATTTGGVSKAFPQSALCQAYAMITDNPEIDIIPLPPLIQFY